MPSRRIARETAAARARACARRGGAGAGYAGGRGTRATRHPSSRARPARRRRSRRRVTRSSRARRFFTRRSRRTRVPDATSSAFRASSCAAGASASCTSTTARGRASSRTASRSTMRSKPIEKPHGRHLLAEEAPDHVVVASAAAERVAEVGVGDLEDRAGVVAHAAHERRVELDRRVGRGPRAARASSA